MRNVLRTSLLQRINPTLPLLRRQTGRQLAPLSVPLRGTRLRRLGSPPPGLLGGLCVLAAAAEGMRRTAYLGGLVLLRDSGYSWAGSWGGADGAAWG